MFNSKSNVWFLLHSTLENYSVVGVNFKSRGEYVDNEAQWKRLFGRKPPKKNIEQARAEQYE